MIKIILDLLTKLFVGITTAMLETPAEKTNVDVQNGDAAPLPDDTYDGLYGGGKAE